MRFAVIGDTTLDVTARQAAPAPGTDHHARITVGPGGQGANVAVRLARHGAVVRLITSIGSDFVGRQLDALLAAEGVEVRSLGAERSGIVVSLVDGSGERAMLSDRISLDPGAWTSGQAWLADADWIHVSGYPLADPAGGAALADLVASRRADQRGSVGGGSFQPGADLADRLHATRPELVLFDREEAAAILDVAASAVAGDDRVAIDLAAALVARVGGVAVVTDGPAGAAVATSDGAWTVSGMVAPMVDATGAGDAHAAGVLLALAGGPWPPSAAALRGALESGGRLGAEATGAVGSQARLPSEVSA